MYLASPSNLHTHSSTAELPPIWIKDSKLLLNIVNISFGSKVDEYSNMYISVIGNNRCLFVFEVFVELMLSLATHVNKHGNEPYYVLLGKFWS